MLRLAITSLALAALLPFNAGAANAPFASFDVLDPTTRGVIIDQDVDGTSPGLGASQFNIFNQFGGRNETARRAAIAAGAITGMVLPVDPTPLQPDSGDEGFISEGVQTVFGLDCDAAAGLAVPTRLTTGDGCLLAAPASFGTAGGGDPFITLGYDGYSGPLGFDPNDIPGTFDVRMSDFTSGTVPGTGATFGINPWRAPWWGQGSIFAGADGTGAEALIPVFHNDWSNLARNINPDLSGPVIPIVALQPGDPLGGNPFAPSNIWEASRAGSLTSPAIWTSDGSTGRVTLPAKMVQDFWNVASLGGLLKSAAAVPGAPFIETDPASPWLDTLGDSTCVPGAVACSDCVDASVLVGAPGLGVCSGAITTPNNFGSYGTGLSGMSALGTVSLIANDPNDPGAVTGDPAVDDCVQAGPGFPGDPGRMLPIVGVGCLDTKGGILVPLQNPTIGAMLAGGAGELELWSDWVIEIDVRAPGGDPSANPTFGAARVTGTGSIYFNVAGKAAPISVYAQTGPGPWLGRTTLGYGADFPLAPDQANCPTAGGECDGGVQVGVDFFGSPTDFFCATDSAIVSDDAGATLGYGGEASDPNGTDGYVLRSSQREFDIDSNPCHQLQTIPYDLATGVLRALGPSFISVLGQQSEILTTNGLREVPEPGTGLMIGLGVAGLALLRRRND